ncbi:MAG: hypothetical protein M3P16_12325 [Chloroflexota bacterium]|nr:hypothetical protein [Chloroflexota bacterium]
MATSVDDVLTPDVVGRLLAAADGPAVQGIAVLGSVARGEASTWSDIDVKSMVGDADAKWPTRPAFIGRRLVMYSSATAAESWAELRRPDKAIWAVPAFTEMRILLDRDGELGRLQAAARSFDYDALRPAAATYLRETAGHACEYIFKIRDGLATRDESKVLHAAASLVGKCERMASVAFLVPIRTENEYYRKVREAAGPAWTSAHRAAFGLDGGDAFAQATAACALFRETIRLVAGRLDDDARAIVGPTLEIAP